MKKGGKLLRCVEAAAHASEANLERRTREGSKRLSQLAEVASDFVRVILRGGQ